MAIDFSALRAQTMGSGNDEEAVTVNTRALIDKVLARYSGEWTVLREMIQNGVDADAKAMVIRFETSPSPTVPVPSGIDPSTSFKHVLRHHTLRRLVVSNDGTPFGPSDWSRLKRIAEGNPDETKIGAFGVGFYSVFADCEEPFVSSGNQALAFYWKNNSLFTRSLQLPNHTGNTGTGKPDTSFVLDYRSTTTPIPNLLGLCQFLANCLTFVGLQSLELWLDEWNLVTFTKKIAPAVHVPLPREIETRTIDQIMKVGSVERENVEIHAKWINAVHWRPSAVSTPSSSASGFGTGGANGGFSSAPSLRSFFSKFAGAVSQANSAAEKAIKLEAETQISIAENIATTSTATVYLRITHANVITSVTPAFAKELERATKKPPPKQTKLAILTASHEEDPASDAGSTYHKSNIFTSMLPAKSGKVFIGFPTQQTTGLLAHISAQSVIPTVERESIDFNARWVRTWNVELLRVAGIVCRIAWSGEMNEIKERFSQTPKVHGRSKNGKDEVAALLPDAIRVCKQFTFHESTPSSQVSTLVEEAFWMCNKKATIEIFSTGGVLPSHEVRIASEDLSGFVDGIPVIPEGLIQGAPEFVNKIKDYNLVSGITIADVKKELGGKALDSRQLVEFLKWITTKAISGGADLATVNSLLDVTVATSGEGDSSSGSTVLMLGQIKYFVNPSHLSSDVPIPADTIPFQYTSNIKIPGLQAIGWEELTIVPWLRFLLESTRSLDPEKDITVSAKFAGQVLLIISKQWESLDQASKDAVISLLSNRTVMPTKAGMRKPGEAYFPSVKIFEDLPTLSGLPSMKEKFLVALGVRKTVELGVVFERLMADPDRQEDFSSKEAGGSSSTGKWSQIQLINYLASVRNDIPNADLKRLRNAPVFSAEGDSQKTSNRRYVISDLYTPTDSLRKLGLPVLQWNGNFRPSSHEGKFLTFLGLKICPSVPEIVKIICEAAAKDDVALMNRAFHFWIDKYHENNYDRYDITSLAVPFLPLQGHGSSKLVKRTDCFTNIQATVLGYPILRSDLIPHAVKLGVKSDPPIEDCVTRLLQNLPTTRRDAQAMFRYFSTRLPEIDSSIKAKLTNANFIPILSKNTMSNGFSNEKGDSSLHYIQPKQCYIGTDSPYGNIFNFVDFGEDANPFLLKAGCKNEPTKSELAYTLVRDPVKVLTELKSYERYQKLLRILAESFDSLRKDKILLKEMKSSTFLIATAIRESPSDALKKATKSRASSQVYDDDSDDEDGTNRMPTLAAARDIIIVDDYKSFSLFSSQLLAAPQEEDLESWYAMLGVPLMSSIVQEEPKIGSFVDNPKESSKLLKLVLERSKIFLYEVPRSSIRNDVRWLEKNLSVQTVRSISLKRTLKGTRLSHTETRTAVATNDPQRGWTLWITAPGYDLYEVSQAIVNLLLSRPQQNLCITLTSLLSTDLYTLQSRGFNVRRILRAQEEQKRIAEDKRLRQLEEERKRIRDEEERYNREQLEAQKRPPKEPQWQATMPGAFSPNSSPEQPPQQRDVKQAEVEHDLRRPRGLFASTLRRLGLDEAKQSNRHLQSLLGSNERQGDKPDKDSPPPYSAHDTTGSQNAETVTAPHQLHENLLRAIQASRSFNSSQLFSPPQTNTVKETATYCDATPSQDLVFLTESSKGMRIFVANHVSDKSGFLLANSTALNLFASLLMEIGQVFALAPECLQIYYDESGSTIAFNSNGSIFCNFRFFKQLHLLGVQQEQQQGEKRADAFVYWWVVYCHELAHNLVQEHSSNHSFYTEQFVQTYFGKVMVKISQMTAGMPGENTRALPPSLI